MADTEPDDDTESLTKSKTKKERTPAQIAAFEKMKAAAAAKLGNKAIDPHKKAVLAMVKEKLNGPPKGAAPPPDSDSEESAVEEPPVPPPKKVKAPKVVEEVVKPPKKSKAPPLPVDDESSSSEEEVIVVKKKKSKKKKTIIYEESSSDEEPAPPKKEVRETRDTKTQQNKASRFKVSLQSVGPSQPVYYFAD